MAAMRRVLLFLMCYMAILVLASRAKGMVPAAWGQIVWGTLSSLVILGMTLLFAHRDGRSARDLGLRLEPGSAWRFALGLVVGLAVYLANFLVVRAVAGPIALVTATGLDVGVVALPVATIFALAIMEELGFRAYPLRTLHARLGLWPTQAIVAVAFALSHVAFGWSWQAVVFGVLPNAFLFGMAAVASGGLAMPIAVHAGVNLARWSFGETGSPGLFTMTIADDARAGIARVAPVTGVLITMAATLGFWYWHRVRVRQPASAP